MRRMFVVIALAWSLGAAASAEPATSTTTSTKSKTAAKSTASKQVVAAKPAEPTPAEKAETAETEARQLADQGRYDDALDRIQAGLAEDPGNTGLLWLEAGVYGWADRHDESVRRYEKLIADHPDMALQLRKDLATQRLWAGDTHGALRDVDQCLAEQPADREAHRLRGTVLSYMDRLPEALATYDSLLEANPEDLDTARERARVLSWMGRHRQAITAYEAILAREPHDVDARVGLAMNENWSGNHERAVQQFEALRADGVTDPEIDKGLAWAEYGSGRMPEARAALDRYRTERPTDSEVEDIARALREGAGGHVTAGFEGSNDSDDLDIGTATVEVGWQLKPRTAVNVHMRRDNVKDPGGDRDPLGIGAGIDHAWNERWSAQARLDALRPDFGANWTAIGELNVTFRPNPRTRYDAGFAKDMVLTRIAMERGVFVRTTTIGGDWDATERMTAHLDERLRSYTDDNLSTTTTGWLRWLMTSHPHEDFHLGVYGAYLSTQHDLDDGYYDPAGYFELAPTARLELRSTSGTVFVGDLRVGVQKENGNKEEIFHAIAGSLALPLATSVSLVVEGGFSDSNIASDSGFRQSRWAVRLTNRF